MHKVPVTKEVQGFFNSAPLFVSVGQYRFYKFSSEMLFTKALLFFFFSLVETDQLPPAVLTGTDL